MSKPRGRPIVIDASVARSAGRSEHPVSGACRDFLEQVLRICHRMTATEAILAEWRKHASRFTRTWQASMYARRKVDRIDPEPRDERLRARVRKLGASQKAEGAMMKDVHLLEAALAMGAAIASCDEEARGLFKRLARKERTTACVVWVNPAESNEQCVEWLRTGAGAEPARRLG